MTELELKIREAAQAYYNDGTSPYSDEEFDALVDQLKIETPNSLLFRVGWGYDVSESTTPGMKREHQYTTIGSLDKCHTLKELGKDLGTSKLEASTKLDGLSVVLYYENSLLKYALTRGDSKIGIDITDKVLKINPMFAHTATAFTGAVRGEILMSYSKFEEFKKLHPEAKNPRNSTAGLINGKDTLEDLKYLDIILYTLVHSDGEPECRSLRHTLLVLHDLFSYSNIIVPSYSLDLREGELDEDIFAKKMDILRGALYRDYPADGIVLSKDDIECKDGTYIYNAKAFKFPSESKITRVIDVEWNMSKTKNCVPRVLLEPIQLSGATVTACAGYHAQYIKENNLGPDSVVEVRRSGEIIPQIIEIHKSTVAKLPETCPDCGRPLSWNGVHLVCTNQDCVDGVEQDLLVWLQNLVPTDGLGDILKLKFINQLVESGHMEDVSIESVMKCKLHLEEDTTSAQFNTFAKMWNKLHDVNFKFDLVHALIACNIPRIGDLTAIKFARYADNIQSKLDGDRSSLANLIGDANSNSVETHIHKLQRLNLIRDRIIWDTEPKVKMKGKVVVTGKLSVKRSAFEAELKRYGYELSNTVNKDTLFLITDNPDSQTSKNAKATKLGVPKITEYDFRFKYL